MTSQHSQRDLPLEHIPCIWTPVSSSVSVLSCPPLSPWLLSVILPLFSLCAHPVFHREARAIPWKLWPCVFPFQHSSRGPLYTQKEAHNPHSDLRSLYKATTFLSWLTVSYFLTVHSTSVMMTSLLVCVSLDKTWSRLKNFNSTVPPDRNVPLGSLLSEDSVLCHTRA